MASGCNVYAILTRETHLLPLKTTFGLQDEDLNVNFGPLGDLVAE